MFKPKKNRLNIFLVISITYILFISLTVYIFYTYEKDKIESVVEHEIEISKKEFNSVLEEFEHMIISELTIKIIQENQIIDSLKLATKIENEEKLNEIRDDLKNKFQSTFESLKREGIDIFHFHLPNSISFLRMHNPEYFGDDLSDFRESINIAQKTGSYIYGYEIGINKGAFRNVIPFLDGSKLIGSIEVSFSEKEIIRVLEQGSMHDDYTFILDKNIVKKVLKSNMKYKESHINSDYIVLKDLNHKSMDSFVAEAISKNELKRNRDFNKIIDYNNEYYLVSLLSIKDISNKHIGYFVKYKKAKNISDIKEETVVKIFFIFLFISIIYFFILKHLISQKKEKFQKNYLDAIFNTQENIIVITEGNKVSDGNQQFLKFFGYGSIEEFIEEHDCICEFMEKIEDRDYIYKDKFGNNWIDTIRQNPEIDWKAEIIREKRRHVFSIKVTYMDFDNRKRSIVSFSDATSMIENQENLENEIERRVKEITIQKDQLQEYKKLVDENVITSSTDTKGFITEVSQAFIEISGYEKAELIGTNHNIVRHPENSKEVYRDMWETIEKGEIWKGEIKNIDNLGEDYWVNASIYPKFDFDDKTKIVGYTAIRQDITDKKKVEELSIRDSLTGLYNRRYFDQIFIKEIETATLNLQSFSFIIADVDNFKKYNDNYGHHEGDEVLRNVSSVFEKSFKCENCYSFRLGGEEFGVVFRNISKNKTLELADKARQNLVNLQIEHKHNEDFGIVTSSFGVVFKEVMSADLLETEIYRIADQGLYLAKNSGRNRVELIEL